MKSVPPFTTLKQLWRMPEAHVLLPWGILTGSLAIFFAIAEEVFEGGTHALDTAILLALRGGQSETPLGPPWLLLSMNDITALGGYTVLMLISAFSMGYLLLRRKWASAALVVVSGVGGIAANHLLKAHFDRARPDVVDHLVDVSTLSFPSGHAMLSAIIYLTLGALLARSQTARVIKIYILSVALILTLLVGISRVYLGVHWPTDVLAGWCLGAAWATGCLLIVKYGNRKTSQI